MDRETPVKIHVKSVIQEGSDLETIEFRTTGFYYMKKDKVYLSYHEEHEAGKVKTIVKASENEVLVMRSGAIEMKQRFIRGSRTVTHYKMPFGRLELGVNTKDISVNHQPLNGNINIVYDMLVSDDQKHLHKMSISYRGGHDL
ncbi:DUF1934 family protein [Bacillus sonorensis]|uniref:Beta-barrel protein YwiB n=2 Tax=Bacillus sonorensis TaxID=119858 RepID=M5P0C2_9BACI|nr:MULTISPECIES: DUF1934 family protein [Bacillus]TWK80754.1 putative beta-barrel protein YwiB [Bacillus paralicheniformis]ASB86970.1 putative beta-barrel protein YwiB [Bacillus sonorensis]EME73541.1 hypothetical protein BSONL12_17524 [Bacillus sonorensis L12]MBG9914516.1 beta-barrel protein ywib [Bacillus sonorensis]MCF7616221.1 DUF1934 family protein [Bacillus sonorensis]